MNAPEFDNPVVRPGDSKSVDQAGEANNATRRDTTQDTVAALEKAREERYKDANPTTQAHNTLKDAPVRSEGDTLPGQQEVNDDENGTPTVATLGAATDRVGPGTGDGSDTRPLGDPAAPQGTGPEVPGGNITAPAAERPAPAGKVRTSWAEQGHTNG